MLYEANLTDEQRSRLRRLGWAMVSKLLLSTAAAVGTKLGEKAVEWFLGDEEDGDDEEPGA